jgi:hypothetical protein
MRPVTETIKFLVHAKVGTKLSYLLSIYTDRSCASFFFRRNLRGELNGLAGMYQLSPLPGSQGNQ